MDSVSRSYVSSFVIIRHVLQLLSVVLALDLSRSVDLKKVSLISFCCSKGSGSHGLLLVMSFRLLEETNLGLVGSSCSIQLLGAVVEVASVYCFCSRVV